MGVGLLVDTLEEAHWDAYGRGCLPLRNPGSDSANPLTTCQTRYHSHLWDHRSTGQL